MIDHGLTIGDEDVVRCTFCHEAQRLRIAVDPAVGRVTITCLACGDTSFRVTPIRDEAGRVVAPPQREPASRPEGPWDRNRRRA